MFCGSVLWPALIPWAVCLLAVSAPSQQTPETGVTLFSCTVVAVLLSSVPLLELLQRVLDVTWTWPSPSEPALSFSEEALLCSAWLLTASLLAHQHSYNSEVRTHCATWIQASGGIFLILK